MRLLFARHGESEANVRHVIANRDSSHGLTPTGRSQALALADAIRAERVARVISSPIRRATETSEIVGGALGVRVELADALREYDCGIYEGRSDEAAWRAHDAIEREWLEQGHAEARLEGGESLIDLHERFVPFIEGIMAGERDPDTTVLLVGHGSLYRCVLPEILDGIDPVVAGSRHLDHARYIVALSGPDGRLTCLDWPG
jgi:broad specificity phosphatase PhoE